jgi:TrmH family RNA methyltransferase
MRPTITSTANARIRSVRGLRRRKERRASGLALVEGIRQVGEAMQLGADVRCLVFAPEELTSEFALGLVEEAESQGVEVLPLAPRVMATLSGRDQSAGLYAVVGQRWSNLDDSAFGLADIAALAEVRDPGNLGTILRSADGAGVGDLVLLDDTTDPYHPAAIRASMGSLFSRRLARATWDDFAAWAQRRGIQLVGTSDHGAVDYRAANYGEHVALLFGTERSGLAEEQLAACGEVVALPMRGRADSLNLAAAASVMLYHLAAQRDAKRA